jgi:FkbM family methyltransferase
VVRGRPAIESVTVGAVRSPAIEVETVVGPLLYPAWDRVVAPALRRGQIWELAETRFLHATLRRGQTFVDVGAHVGYFTVLASKIVGSGGRVFAVEPAPENVELLRLNLTRNECTNVVVLPVAAAAAPGRATLELDEENSGGHRLLPPNTAGTPVECVRLDDVIPASPDVVKVDAQGYDHEVVDGLERLLAGNPRMTVLVELSPGELAHRDVDPASVLDRYVAEGFAISTLDERGRLYRSSAGDVLAGLSGGRFPRDFSLVLERHEAVEALPRRVDGLEVRPTREGVLRVYDPARDRLHSLNDTAALVFELCTGTQSVAAIVAAVQAAYALRDPPTTEVEQCLAHLRVERLVA